MGDKGTASTMQETQQEKVIRQKITQQNIGMYGRHWAEVDTLARTSGISLSAAMRIIVEFWCENRDPSDTDVRLKALAERNMRGLVTDDEYINETQLLILTGK